MSDDATARVPTYHELCAALVAARQVDAAGAVRSTLEQSFLRTPTDGLYQALELERAGQLLERIRLLRAEGEGLIPTSELLALREAPDEQALELLLHLCLLRCPPLWLSGAGEDRTPFENAADGDAESIRRVIADPDRREAFLLALAQRHVPGLLDAIGDAAERAVEGLLVDDLRKAGRQDLAKEVRRVSRISDRLGYDITTPTLDGQCRRLEVKGSASSCISWIEVNLSRNEFLVGSRDPAWRLVACRVRGGVGEVLGTCGIEAISPHVPQDVTTRGRWSSASIRLLIGDLVPGVPLQGR